MHCFVFRFLADMAHAKCCMNGIFSGVRTFFCWQRRRISREPQLRIVPWKRSLPQLQMRYVLYDKLSKILKSVINSFVGVPRIPAGCRSPRRRKVKCIIWYHRIRRIRRRESSSSQMVGASCRQCTLNAVWFFLMNLAACGKGKKTQNNAHTLTPVEVSQNRASWYFNIPWFQLRYRVWTYCQTSSLLASAEWSTGLWWGRFEVFTVVHNRCHILAFIKMRASEFFVWHSMLLCKETFLIESSIRASAKVSRWLQLILRYSPLRWFYIYHGML